MKKVLFLWTSESSKWKLMLHCDHQRNRKKRMYSQIIGRCVHRPNWHNYLELLTFHTFTYISSLEFPYVNFSSVYEMHICIFNAPQHLMEIECCFFLFNFNSRSFHQLIFMQTASLFFLHTVWYVEHITWNHLEIACRFCSLLVHTNTLEILKGQ